jgi:hypothetical protein
VVQSFAGSRIVAEAERARRKISYLDAANLNRDVDFDGPAGSAEADKTLGH